VHKNRIQRLHYLVELLEQGMKFTFAEMQLQIEKKFNKKLQERMLRKDLSYLREIGIGKGPLNIKVEDFRYFLSNEFTFRAENLNQIERATLPFLLGLLQPYQKVAAVEALYKNIIEVHRLDTTEVNQMAIAFQSNSAMNDSSQLRKVAVILENIHLQQAVEFNYVKVIQGVNREFSDDQVSYRRMFPLQVKEYLGRYYLVGINISREPTMENIQIFPVDRFINGPNAFIADDSEEPLKFDWKHYYKSTNLSTYFTHCIGILRNHQIDVSPVYVYRWFKEWAASYVEAVPLHWTQEIVQRSQHGAIRVRLNVFDNHELKGRLLSFGEYCWE
jgi:hypothetical protein